MKRFCATAAFLILCCSFASAQTTQNTGGVTPNTGGVANPSTRSNSTVGSPPAVNPSNPADASGKSNPQDLTKPGASNPSDLKRK